ncbi:alanine--tRNA ligase-related protein, partial [Salmonella enterica]|uniref:alanine--tRNA ligase-related protein n=1 Tax=Salmonella enterica TaxID=28901 RepID=UPI000CCB101D
LTTNTEFLGYESLESSGRIKTIIAENSFVDEINSNNKVQIVFDQTPFYAEKGGQIGDTGQIRSEDGEIVGYVVDVQSAPAGQPLHEVNAV